MRKLKTIPRYNTILLSNFLSKIDKDSLPKEEKLIIFGDPKAPKPKGIIWANKNKKRRQRFLLGYPIREVKNL
jgi:hypothetical protein